MEIVVKNVSLEYGGETGTVPVKKRKIKLLKCDVSRECLK